MVDNALNYEHRVDVLQQFGGELDDEVSDCEAFDSCVDLVYFLGDVFRVRLISILLTFDATEDVSSNKHACNEVVNQ